MVSRIASCHTQTALSTPSKATMMDSLLLNLIKTRKVGSTALLLLVALVNHDRKEKNGYRKGYVWPSNARLAQLVGCSIRTVQRHIRYLERAGWVGRTQGRLSGARGRDSVIVIHWDKITLDAKGDKSVTWNKRALESEGPQSTEHNVKGNPKAAYSRFTNRDARDQYLRDARTRALAWGIPTGSPDTTSLSPPERAELRELRESKLLLRS